jgi:hypothetical protein
MALFVNRLIVWTIEQYILKASEIKIFYFMFDDRYTASVIPKAKSYCC